MVRRLAVTLVVLMTAFALVSPARAQDAGSDEGLVEPASLDGFAYAITQEYAAAELLRGGAFDMASHDGLIRLSVTVSRFEDARRAGAAWDAMKTGIVPAIERSPASSGLEIENVRAGDVDGLGDRAYAVSFTAGTQDLTFDSKHLLVVQRDLVFAFVVLAIGEEHLARVDAIAGAMLARQPDREGVEGLAALLPPAGDPVLKGLVPTTSSRETPVPGD